MSTRCQVTVIQEGMPWPERSTLYHHSDGYPENIVPLIGKALQGHILQNNRYADKLAAQSELDKDYWDRLRGVQWQMGRAAKVAGRLCWADPDQFEPEDSHDLHVDIEYFYRLFVVNHETNNKPPTWELEVLQPVNGFWDNPTEKNLKVKHKRQPLEKLLKKYPAHWDSHKAE